MSLTTSEIIGLQTSKYFNGVSLEYYPYPLFLLGALVWMIYSCWNGGFGEIYDYVITFEDELRWVWGRKWDATRIVFTVSRYLPFWGTVTTVYDILRSPSEPCLPGMEEFITHTISVAAAEVLLILRTYAFWDGDKRVLYGLFAYAGVTTVAIIGTNVTRTPLLPGGYISKDCLLTDSRNVIFVYSFLLAFEVVILFMTALKRFLSYREVMAPIVRTMYRDGMFYIACVILITFGNVIIHSAFPFQFSGLFHVFQITLHSVLASRIMFSLRESVLHPQTRRTTDATLTNIACYTPPDPSLTGFQSSGSPSENATSIATDVDIVLETHPVTLVNRGYSNKM